jgi:hypothetical protein
MPIRSALALGLLALGLVSCGDVRTSAVGPGNSQDTFQPAANIDGQAQPTGDGALATDVNRNNPGYGYTLKQPPKPD